MDSELENSLQVIIANKHLHARWINTFSYLEYIGFRKIKKNQTSAKMTVDRLSHAVEEGRHALRLKRLAVKIGGREFENYALHTTIGTDAALAYFRELDRACESFNKDLNYFYVTWVVELRALAVYRHYLRFVDEPSVRALIGEEENHLKGVHEKLTALDFNFSENSERLRREEKKLYGQFLQSVREALRGVNG